MAVGFDDGWAETTIAELRSRGTEFGPGFDNAEIDEIARLMNAPVPPELATFWRHGVPVSRGWATWRSGPQLVAAETRDALDHVFEFDIRTNGYWHSSFGPKPDDVDAAVGQALDVVRAAPPLLRLHGHRYLCTAPDHGTRPVLSVFQAVDSIRYGNDLADYLAREFGITRPDWAASRPPPAPVWERWFWSDEQEHHQFGPPTYS